MNYKADWSRETSWAQWLIVYQDKNILKDFKGINKGLRAAAAISYVLD